MAGQKLRVSSRDLAAALRTFDTGSALAVAHQAAAARLNADGTLEERWELLEAVATDAAQGRWSAAHLALLDHLSSC